MSFEQFDFDQRISAGIASAGYTVPTPIQEQAIGEVLAGRDVLGLAQTGTGKTAAFALPILQKLVATDAPRRGPAHVLVLAPTRELAVQIQKSFIELGKQTGIRCAAVFGGVGFGPQIKAVRQATIVVACPGRLLDLLHQKAIDLRSIDTLVLDEADRMLDMGFMPDIKKILAYLPQDGTARQNLLFSATMPPDIRKLADRILREPSVVQVEKKVQTAQNVSHAFYPVPQHLKNPLLDTLLEGLEYDSLLIFTRTKHRAKNLARKLDRAGHSATFLQGNMTQNQRQRALDGFKCGSFRIMVATDIAARGIDCASITHVINYDAPDTAETYTHRIGRTGRAGRSGEALSFMTGEDRAIERAIRRMVPQKVAEVRVEGFDYATPATASDHAEAARDSRFRGPGRPGGKSGGKFVPKSGGKPGPKSGAKAGPKSGAKPGPKSGAKPGPKAGTTQGEAKPQGGGGEGVLRKPKPKPKRQPRRRGPKQA